MGRCIIPSKSGTIKAPQLPYIRVEGWQLEVPDAHPRPVTPDLRQLEIVAELRWEKG
jgi:hypothetical protein